MSPAQDHLDCSAALQAASARLDDELPADRGRDLDLHLAGCEACQQAAAGLARISKGLRSSPLVVSRDPAPRALVASIQAGVRRAHEWQSAPAADRRRGVVVNALRLLRVDLAAAFLAVAGITLALLLVQGAPSATAGGSKTAMELDLEGDRLQQLLSSFASPERARAILQAGDRRLDATASALSDASDRITAVFAGLDEDLVTQPGSRPGQVDLPRLLALLGVAGLDLEARETPPNPRLWPLDDVAWERLWQAARDYTRASEARHVVLSQIVAELRQLELDPGQPEAQQLRDHILDY